MTILGVEKRWRANLNERFRKLKGRVNRYISNYQGDRDAAFVNQFDDWFGRQIDDLFFTDGNLDWQDALVAQAFIKGLITSTAQLRREGIALVPDVAAYNNSVSLFKKQANGDLKGITAEVRAQASRNLITAVLANEAKTELSKIVNDRVDKIGKTRSHTLANTRTTEIYDSAIIQQAQKAAEETGEDALLLWITRGDERVRTTHALRNRKLYTPKVANRLIGEPGCRCRLEIQIGEGTKKEREERARIRKRELKVSEQAQDERRFFESIGTRTGNPVE